MAEQEGIVATHAINFTSIINMDKLFSKENIAGLKMIYGTDNENEILKRIMGEQQSRIEQVLNRNIFVPLAATAEPYGAYVERQQRAFNQSQNQIQNDIDESDSDNNNSSNIDIKDKTRDNGEEHVVLSNQENELINNIAQSVFELSSEGVAIEKIIISDKLSHDAVLNLSNQYHWSIEKDNLALNDFRIIKKENTEAE
ncbi:MAG: hypothetical protein ABF991_00200 [Liquorilactobacillus hordei]|uniref:hypothetical protein n=1 Tax=Liquorilactobacillus hordei TaxID=468911 RepID=UPI0039EBD3E0